MVYVFLAGGCEEIEALTPVDILRRGGAEVVTVGVGGKIIRSSHGINIEADITENEVVLDDEVEGIVLPGGMPGTINLEHSACVQKSVQFCAQRGLMIGAICAAPSILGHCGLLAGKEATVYPSFEEELKGAVLSSSYVVRDGNIITARGMGVSVDFGLALLAAVRGSAASDKVRKSIQCAEQA